MFRKLFILMVAASALGACESQSGGVMAPPLAKAGTANPAQAPVSYMTFFELGSTKLSEQSMATISEAAQVVKKKGNPSVVVTGYADTVGSPAANMQLAQRRANVVKDALVAAGVSAATITTASSGETNLLVATGPQVNQPKNRRVVIVVN